MCWHLSCTCPTVISDFPIRSVDCPIHGTAAMRVTSVNTTWTRRTIPLAQEPDRDLTH